MKNRLDLELYPQKRNVFSDVCTIILFVILMIVIVVTQTFSLSSVSGSSMLDTIENGDYVVCVNPDDLNYRDIVRADTGDGKYIIKRVIGLPGDKILFKADGREVMLWIDSGAGFVLIDESEYIRNGRMSLYGFSSGRYGSVYDEGESENIDDFVISLSEDEYFLMGDNRDASTDSRVYGPFKKSEIKSKVKKIINKENDEGLHNFIGFLYGLLSGGSTTEK